MCTYVFPLKRQKLLEVCFQNGWSRALINGLQVLAGLQQLALSKKTVINDSQGCLSLCVYSVHMSVAQQWPELLIHFLFYATCYDSAGQTICPTTWFKWHKTDTAVQFNLSRSSYAALLCTSIYYFPPSRRPFLQIHLKIRLISGDCYARMRHPPAIGNVPYQSNLTH